MYQLPCKIGGACFKDKSRWCLSACRGLGSAVGPLLAACALPLPLRC
jgi:hypothetical protein